MLTDKAIRSAMKAVETETILTDGAAGRGTGALRLVIRRNKGGVSALWFAAWKRDGQRRKLALGRYPDVPLLDARKKFEAALRPAISAGKIPRAVPELAQRPTVERLFEGYVAALRAAGKGSADDVERLLLTSKRQASADAIGRHRMAGEIEPGDIAAHLAEIADRGALRAADIRRAYLSAAFNWGIKAAHNYRAAVRQDWGIRSNPVADVPKDPDASTPRDRVLSAAEIRTLWFATEGPGWSPSTRLVVRLVLCTGQRIKEILRARTEHFDLDAGTWELPGVITKGGKPHMIPLPAIAIEELRRALPKRGPLFPPDSGEAEHMPHTTLSHAVADWIAASGAEHFQPRDLRRTWKTRAGQAGVDRFIRDLIQQHAQASDTGSKHYDHADYLPEMRAAMLRWNAWLERVLHSPASGLVRPLRA